jgi:competence CoiA-like predicted nuclease
MRFAYDDNRTRIRPFFSGQKAKCPLCGGTLIGKCGEIYAWHWQHHHDRECDPWKEHETEWHRRWKAKFPEIWQEVIIEKRGEKHIADIKTPLGLIIEFQNSSISTTTISIREDFYEDMIWVVNAKTFKDNFKIRSVVKSCLRNIEKNATYELKWLQDSYAEDLTELEEDLKKNQKETKDKFNSIKYKTTTVDHLKQLLKDNELFTNTVIEKWTQGELYWDYQTNEITSNIKSETKAQLQNIPKQINQLKVEIKSNEKCLLDIFNLENFRVGEKTFKIVEYDQVPSTCFKKVRAISKSSKNTFFPEIKEFKSELEFINFQYRKEQFDFAVDPTNAINTYQQKIENCKITIDALEKLLPTTKKTITDKLIQELKNKIQELEDEIEKLNNEWDELIKKNSRLVQRQAKILEERDEEIRESKIEIEKKKNEKRFKIMREKKGLYSFEWKHERKSWKAAYNTIYFDIGENYLFELVKEGLFKKTDIQVFLEKYLQMPPVSHIIK